MAPLDVVLASYTLGLGGTEKSLVNHALALDRERVRPRVVGIFGGGPRVEELRAAGIPVTIAERDRRRLADALKGADLVHAYRPGGTEPLLPAAARDAGIPRLVETNVFGHVDPTPEAAQFDCRLFMSQMCAIRYRRLVGIDHDALFERHRVLYNPLDLRQLRSLAPEPAQARDLLGLDPERPVVARVGRADDRKWAPIVIEMLPTLLRLVPEAQVLLVGATPAKRKLLRRRGLLERVRLLEPTSEEARLAAFYRAADVLVTASSIGESFGVAIAEAMALGVPVVTNSTPWTDNAQVELIDHGVTGYVANHPRAFGEAVAQLLTDDQRRRAFAVKAAAKASQQWDVAPLTRRLEDLYESLVHNARLPAEWSPSADELAAFETDYAARSARQFRSLTAREQLESRLTVLRERAGWLAHDVRTRPQNLPALLAMARDRVVHTLPRMASQSSAGKARRASRTAR